MKRALVASILGIAASVASSYGQANILFDTYLSSPFAIVQWSSNPALAPAGRAGSATTAGEFVANLLWTYGTTTGSAGLAVPTTGDVGTYGSGFIMYPNVVSTAANFPGGPINFTIQVWQGADYASAMAKGEVSWTEPSGAFVPAGPASAFTALPGNIIVTVPEPSTLALAGLGAAAMLIFRRRQ